MFPKIHFQKSDFLRKIQTMQNQPYDRVPLLLFEVFLHYETKRVLAGAVEMNSGWRRPRESFMFS